jgi:hypothetical protein
MRARIAFLDFDPFLSTGFTEIDAGYPILHNRTSTGNVVLSSF